MVDVGSIDRVRWGIGIQDILKGGVIEGEGLTWYSVVQIGVCRGIWGLEHLWECQWVDARCEGVCHGYSQSFWVEG